MSEEPALQAPISLTEASAPLGELLQRISQRYSVELKADQTTGYQRISLRVDSQPLHRVMTRLAALLSHSVTDPPTYRWSRVRAARRSPGVAAIFRLTKGERARTQELEHLRRPARKMQEILRELRALARLSAQDRAASRTSLHVETLAQTHVQPYLKAFAPLTNTQLNRLLAGGTLEMNPALFEREAARAAEKWSLQQKEAELGRVRAVAAGEPDPFPNGVPGTPRFAPTLAVRRNDPDGDHPQGSVQYFFDLSQATEAGIGYLPLWYDHPNQYEELPDTRVDLTAELNSPGVSDAQRGDVGFTLAALAQAAKLTLYQEHFYQPTTIGSRFSGFRTLRGPLREVIRAICDTWQYRVVKQDDEYFFWPYAWALDRSVDVPELIIERWRSRLKAQGELSLEDLAEMAVTFSQGQLSQTMRIGFPEAGRWGAENTRLLRIWGLLSPRHRAAASSFEGLPLEALPSGARNLLLQELTRARVEPRPDELRRSRLTWSAPEIRPRRERGFPEPRVMALVSPERSLFRRSVQNDAARNYTIGADQLHLPH